MKICKNLKNNYFSSPFNCINWLSNDVSDIYGVYPDRHHIIGMNFLLAKQIYNYKKSLKMCWLRWMVISS